MAHSKMAPKRKVNVRGQKHSLAYINDREKRMLRQAGGSGKPGPSGVPTYFDVGEGMGGYGSGMDDDATGGAGDRDGGRDDGGTYSDSQTGRDTSNDRSQSEMARSSSLPSDFLADKVASRKDPFTGIAAKLPIGAVLNSIAKGVRGKIEKELRAGGTAIFNKKREIMGVMHDGLFGLGKVYTGRTMAPEDYDGPEEFRNNVTLDGGRDGGDDNIRGGAANKVTKPVDLVEGNVNLPELPDSGDGGDATDDAKRRSKMGKESTIATTGQGLLGSAKTRNRSLMSGLIS